MGFGDDVMASGFARGMCEKGKRAAFGDGKRIVWGPWSEEVFRNNPNVARPGSEPAQDLIWVDYYKGHRKYNQLDRKKERWIWNFDFKAVPGEIFFDRDEGHILNEQFIFVEPNVPWHKSVAVNKDWGLKRYQAVVDLLKKDGHTVVQTHHGRDKLSGVKFISTPTFRSALSLMKRAKAALIPEGGLHHGAAAVGVPATVIFGGFIPPAVTGYDGHINLTGNSNGFCGNLNKCLHCRETLDKISVEEVYSSMKKLINGRA